MKQDIIQTWPQHLQRTVSCLQAVAIQFCTVDWAHARKALIPRQRKANKLLTLRSWRVSRVHKQKGKDKQRQRLRNKDWESVKFKWKMPRNRLLNSPRKVVCRRLQCHTRNSNRVKSSKVVIWHKPNKTPSKGPKPRWAGLTLEVRYELVREEIRCSESAFHPYQIPTSKKHETWRHPTQLRPTWMRLKMSKKTQKFKDLQFRATPFLSLFNIRRRDAI